MKLRVGIAGYGAVGKRRRKCIDAHPDLELVALCDQTLVGDGKFDDDVLFFNHYDDLIEQELDVLFVCLTNDVAVDAVVKGLEKGCHVFCEKPPGRNLEDVSKAVATKKIYPKQRLMYGFNHRYHHSVREAQRIIHSGELGKILNLRGVYGKSSIVTFNQSDWRTKKEIAGGGVLLDQGIHMVDLMRLFAGEFTQVHSFISNRYWSYDVEDNAYALMKTDDGIVGMLHSSATQWRHRFHLDINLEKGSLILSGILSSSKSYGAETLAIVWADPETDGGDPKEHTMRYNIDPSWDEEVDTFVQAIKTNKPIGPGSVDDAYKTMSLVETIYNADPQWNTTTQDQASQKQKA